jgi:hypothetical protein
MKCLHGLTNPQVTVYVNQYFLRSNWDQMHMVFLMVDHNKINPAKYKDVFCLPKNWQKAWNMAV